MHDDRGRADLPADGLVDEENLSFVAFSLKHAGCGEAVMERRLAEDSLLAWCAECSVLEVFGSARARSRGARPRP